MKLKVCPKCGCGARLGDRWVTGRRLQQFCSNPCDKNENNCSWEGEPRIPEHTRITNTAQLRIANFQGWHYLIYDTYGHLQTSSATYATRAKAMQDLQKLAKAKKANPAAPLTAVLFYVPPNVTVKGTMFKFKKGQVVTTKVKKTKITNKLKL